MLHYSKLSVLTTSLLILFFSGIIKDISAQVNPLTKAIQLFDKKKFTEAEPAFKILVDERPDDFMINYFYGACRTENEHYSEQDLGYLVKASKEVYPLEIDYYLGVQYHARSEWSKAYTHYNSYRKVASTEELKRVDLASKIDQCVKLINPFVKVDSTAVAEMSGVADSSKVVLTKTETAEKPNVTNAAAIDATFATIEVSKTAEEPVIDTVTQKSDSTGQTEVIQEQEIIVEPEKTEPAEPIINFNINNEITYFFASAFKTESGKVAFAKGVEKQTELEKIMLRTEILRGQYAQMKTRAEKDSVGRLILELENDSYSLKDSVRLEFVNAKYVENEYWQNAKPDEITGFLEVQNQKLQQANKIVEKTETVNSDIIISPLFIEEPAEKTPAAAVKPSPVTYKIQIGAYSKGIPANMKSVFNKISTIRKVETYVDEKGVTVYTTGNLTRFEDAVVMQNQVKQEGIKGAIIAGYSNGKRITLDQAKQLEKQK